MKHRLLIILIFFTSLGTFAQNELRLSLEDAQNYALEHNLNLKNSSLDIQKAESAKWQALATMLPQINATVDYSNMLGYELNFGGLPISMPSYVNFSGSASVAVSASQIIGLSISDISTKMSDITLSQSKQDITNQVKSSYYQALVMEKINGLLAENLQQMNQLYQFTLESVKVGVTEQTEADKLLVQVATLKAAISSNDRVIKTLYSSIKLQLGTEPTTELKLTQSIDDLMNLDNAISLTGASFNLSDNYNYQLLEQNLALMDKQVTMSKWAYAPTLSAYYQYSSRYEFSDEPGFNMTPPNVIGASLNIPIFSSGSRKHALNDAKYSYEQQVNTLELTRQSLLLQHQQLVYNLKSAYESYNVQKQNIEVTQRVFENITQKYKHGMASSLEVTTSGTEVTTAQSNYVQALMDVVTAQIELENLLNK